MQRVFFLVQFVLFLLTNFLLLGDPVIAVTGRALTLESPLRETGWVREAILRACGPGQSEVGGLRCYSADRDGQHKIGMNGS